MSSYTDQILICFFAKFCDHLCILRALTHFIKLQEYCGRSFDPGSLSTRVLPLVWQRSATGLCIPRILKFPRGDLELGWALGADC